MSGVFLSYSRGDRALAEQIIQGLRALGIDVWWDEDMPGVDWQEELERQITLWHREDEASQRLQVIPGIGPLTASALVASVGDARVFRSARQFAAWLGLVPRQSSTGGKTNLLGISKRGDVYLRTLLIHGARSLLVNLKRHPDRLEGWLARVAARRNANIAGVAMANKNARIVWALLAHGRDYQAGYRSAPIAATA